MRQPIRRADPDFHARRRRQELEMNRPLPPPGPCAGHGIRGHRRAADRRRGQAEAPASELADRPGDANAPGARNHRQGLPSGSDGRTLRSRWCVKGHNRPTLLPTLRAGGRCPPCALAEPPLAPFPSLVVQRIEQHPAWQEAEFDIASLANRVLAHLVAQRDKGTPPAALISRRARVLLVDAGNWLSVVRK